MAETLRDPRYNWTYPKGNRARVIADFFRLVVRSPGPHANTFYIVGEHREDFGLWLVGDTIDFVLQGKTARVGATAVLASYNPAPHNGGHGIFTLV